MIQLSASKLGIFNDCKRCFWLANVKGIEQPRGIFPGLPGGIDRNMKVYFDKYRGKVPPELIGQLPGVLMPDIVQLKRWRHWKTGLVYTSPTIRLIGALDDCLIDAGFYMPLDNKTKGFEPEDDGKKYYQTQMDCYGLLLQANGFETNGKGYIVYVWPENVSSVNNLLPDNKKMFFKFGTKVYELESSPKRAKELIAKALDVLAGAIPNANPRCGYCSLVEKRVNSASYENERNYN